MPDYVYDMLISFCLLKYGDYDRKNYNLHNTNPLNF